MAFRSGFVKYENVDSGDLGKIIQNLQKFRYFVTERLICEITVADPQLIFQYLSIIYFSTYSPMDPPIYLLVPQLVDSEYLPLEDYIFTDSFITEDMEKLSWNTMVEVSSIDVDLNKKFRSGCMGGTFDHLHPGHLLLLTAAAAVVQDLGIGITDPSILGHKKNQNFIQPWKIRVSKVKEFLGLLKKQLNLDTFPLLDPVCKAAYGDFDVVILTTEVESSWELINKARKENSLNELEKSVISVLGVNNIKVSSTEIRSILCEKSKGFYDILQERWGKLCGTLGVNKELQEKWWDFISSQYSRNCRYYHTLSHLNSCFSHMNTPTPTLELAVFFHDLIYFPMKHRDLPSNEALSAEYFSQFLSETGLQGLDSVSGYIISTIDHVSNHNSLEEMEFLDIDMSILATDWEEYKEYASDIRKEYNWYTDEEFSKGRSQVLRTFLTQSQIFCSDQFKSFESKARENIRKELEILLIN